MRYVVLRGIIAAFAVVVAVAAVLRTDRTVRLESVLDISRLSEEALPELLQRIRDFHRVVTRDGKKLLEVSASEASYFRNDRAVQIVSPEVIFYDDGVQVGSIAGSSGWLMLEGNEIEAVSLKGAVELVLTKFVVLADEITYERTRDMIITKGVTEVRSPEIKLAGKDLTFDLNRKTLIVDSQVDMTLQPGGTATSSSRAATGGGGAS